MARLQILSLPPARKPDGTIEPRFALVVDQCTPVPPLRYVTGSAPAEHEQAWKDIAAEHNHQVWTDPSGAPWPLAVESEKGRWEAFAEAIGACAVVFTAEKVDLAQASAEGTTGQPGEVHHWHFKDAALDHRRLDSWAASREARRRGDGGGAGAPR